MNVCVCVRERERERRERERERERDFECFVEYWCIALYHKWKV